MRGIANGRERGVYPLRRARPYRPCRPTPIPVSTPYPFAIRIRHPHPHPHLHLHPHPHPHPHPPSAIRHPPSAIRSCTLLTSTPPDNRDICLSKACMSISAQSATVRMRTRSPEALFRGCRLQPCTMYRAPNMQHRRSRAQALTGMPGNHSIRAAKNAEQSSRHRHIG